ncbi:HK97 family phage prohead protease [Sodalis sp.]|uniref:HK97 family phage prohead protease n=1 Tax=Sodalis sp. (in: enterobacteria) TaxID=1898979 RepID=UPI003872F0A8
MPTIQKTLAFEQAEIKFAGDVTQGIFDGYASVFHHTDADGDVFLPGAFKKALSNPSRQVAMFFNHRTWELPVGKWTALDEDARGLRVRGELTPGHRGAQDLMAAMKHGSVEGLSVGFQARREDYDVSRTGRIYKNVAALQEISICTFPANEQANVSSIKSLDGIDSIRDAENWLRDSAGLSKSQAMGLIARIKSALRSESEGDTLAALCERIKSFPLQLGK